MSDMIKMGQIEAIDTDKMYVEITSECNLRCIHCYNDSGAGKNEHMTIDVFSKIIEYVSQTNYRNIAISGGEPLLNPQFYRFIDLCRMNGVSYTIVTNGLLIDEGFIEYFNGDTFLDGIQISIEGGTAAVHDRIRGNGAFSKLMQKLDLLHKNNMIQKISLKMTLTGINYIEMSEACDLAASLGVYQISFGWINHIGRGAVNQDMLSLTQSMIGEALQSGEYVMGKRKDTLCSGVGVAHTCALSRFSPRMIISARITSDGDVYPCSMFESNPLFRLGRLTENSLDDILNSERTKTLLYIFILRKELLLKCETCAVKPVCGRGCIARAYSINGTVFSTDDCCDFNRKSILQSYGSIYKKRTDVHDA